MEITNTQLQADIFNAYQFTSMISDSNNVLWDFGNGDTSSQINPTYQYSSVGNYQVILTS